MALLQVIFPVILILTVSLTGFLHSGYRPTADFNRCTASLTSHALTGARIMISKQVCFDLCTTGYQPWPVQDVFDRFTLWVVPAMIQVTHFVFAPLSFENYIAVILHASGDPIDSLWSILTRFEMNRRLLRIATEAFAMEAIQVRSRVVEVSEDHQSQCRRRVLRRYTRLRGRLTRFVHRLPKTSTHEEQIATLWAAYDEIGWMDAASRFIDEREARNLPHILIEPHEWSIITKASYRLSCMRQSSLITTFVPIFSLAIGLALAIVRTFQGVVPGKTTRNSVNETAHTIGVVCLLFHFIPLTAFSGSIGAFTTVSAAADVIIQLREDLGAETNRRMDTLFPALKTPSWKTCSKCYPKIIHSNKDLPDETGTGEIRVKTWPKVASYMGVNPTWRPCKHLRRARIEQYKNQSIPFWRKPFTKSFWKHSERTKLTLLLISLLFVVGGSAIPAMFLSMTNSKSWKQVGVGCRSLSWITILGCWLFSFADDFFMRANFRHKHRLLLFPWLYNNPRRLWNQTVAKDAFCTAIIATLIGFEQIGFYNSCWCKASFGQVELQPWNTREWARATRIWSSIAPTFFVFNLLITMWMMFVGGRPKNILSKSEETLQADLEELQEDKLDSEDDGSIKVLSEEVSSKV